MSLDLDRWRRVIAFDVCAQAFIEQGRQSAELGDIIAASDTCRLWLLAGRVAHALADWQKDIALLDLARAATLTPQRAARLISEGLFDETLTPPAYAVFDKALDLALDGLTTAPGRPS